MPGEDKDEKHDGSHKDGKNPSKSKKGSSNSNKTQKNDIRPPRSKKGGKSQGKKEKEAPESKKEETEPKEKAQESSKSEDTKGEEQKTAEPEGEAPKTEDEERDSKEAPKEDTSLEDTLKTYITAYIDSYMDYVEEQNIKEGDFPLLYAYYPLDVTGYILPDESTCVLFKGLAAATNIKIKKADYQAVDREVTDKRYDYISCYPANFSYTKEEAEREARRDVGGDIEYSTQLGTVKAERAAKDETLKSIRLLFVAMPWVANRKKGAGFLKFPEGVKEQQYTADSLSMKEEEYFSGFSDRIHALENALLHGTKIATEPSEEEEKEPEEEKKELEEEKPAQPPVTEVAVPVAATSAPGTHVTVEIKQPEAPGKGEGYKDRAEEEILRLKKTLYIQSRDIEELRRANEELSSKLGNLEQMRQTVFRVNRKVFDSDARMSKLEKSNMEILRRFAELRAEQVEQNKKMRRFIAERAKKARNQAMALAGIALAIGMAALALLILGIDLQSLLGF